MVEVFCVYFVGQLLGKLDNVLKFFFWGKMKLDLGLQFNWLFLYGIEWFFYVMYECIY